MNNKSVLVTGGAGFIGHNLCSALLARGCRVYAVDNLITGRIKNIEPLLKNKKFHFFKLDITKPKFKKIFSHIPLKQIYHLACPTGVPNIQKFAQEMALVNSLGTINVLELARMHKAQLLFSSSCEVYGEPKVFPQSESYCGYVDPIGPRSPYEEGKRFSEALIVMYVKKYNLDARIIRIFNTYGPGMSLDDQRVIPQFLRSIVADESFIIYGNGQQTRTFLYIDDLIKGFFLVMEKGKAGEIYNLGGRQQVPIKKLANLVIKLNNYKNGVRFVPHFINDHNGRQPSLRKIKSLGWRQEISLREGLKRMLIENGLK